MSSVRLEHIKGRELAERVAEAVRVDPDRFYRVTVQTEDEELAEAGSLSAVAETVSKRARERGLTPDILRDILDDDE